MKKMIALLVPILMLSICIFSIAITLFLKKYNNVDMETSAPVSISHEANKPDDAVGHYTVNENENKQTVLTHGFVDLQQIDMPYVCDELYMVIKAVYDDYDFYGEFETGDSMVYDEYKEIFKQLFTGEAALYDKNSEMELALSDFSIDVYDKNHNFYFFDMDEDGTPELIIDRKCILKYDLDLDKIVLWYDLTHHYEVIGSKKITWIHLGSGYGTAFYWLDTTGEEENQVFVYTFGKPEGGVYLVTLPLGFESDLIKRYDYRDRSNHYFKVTEEQFLTLTYDLYNALEEASNKEQEIIYTYAELFGE